MKFWKTLLPCCVICGTCYFVGCSNLDKAKVQKKRDMKEVQAIENSVFLDYSCLDIFEKTAEILALKTNTSGEYAVLNAGGVPNALKILYIIPDATGRNIDAKQGIMKPLWEKNLNDDSNPFLKTFKDEEKRYNNLKNLDEAKKDIVQFLGCENKGDIVPKLAEAIRRFWKHSAKFYEDLEKSLNNYNNSGFELKMRRNIEAFAQLAKFLKPYSEKYQEGEGKKKFANDLALVNFFFDHFLPQYYNVYYENIFREKKGDKGEHQRDLYLVRTLL